MALFKNKKLLVVMAVVVILAVVVIATLPAGREVDPSQTTTPTSTENTAQNMTDETLPMETSPRETDPDETSPQETDPEETHPEETTPEQTYPQDTLPPEIWETVPEIGVSYEQWLGAAMVTAVSMEYPDFEIYGIYAASETALENAEKSRGTYILFESEAQQILIQSRPLTGERSEPGTTDLYTPQLGFATYDKVDIHSVDLTGMEQLTLEELGELMDYSVLISLYSR